MDRTTRRFQPKRGSGVAWRLGGSSYGPQGLYSPDRTWMPKSGIYELADERGTGCRFV